MLGKFVLTYLIGSLVAGVVKFFLYLFCILGNFIRFPNGEYDTNWEFWELVLATLQVYTGSIAYEIPFWLQWIITIVTEIVRWSIAIVLFAYMSTGVADALMLAIKGMVIGVLKRLLIDFLLELFFSFIFGALFSTITQLVLNPELLG